jgi:patatin-like phospholipase/acyl hydrolase
MTKRILSIDGGGIRGILPLALLVEIETRRAQPCADLFDLIAGTSIGGIIATGLAHRVSAKTLYDMLMADGGTIFAKSIWTDPLSTVEPKYDAAPLETFLAQTLDGFMLDGIKDIELMVPACDLIRVDTIFFKSWRARQNPSYNFALKDIARATSAAETYFSPAQINSVPGDVYRCVDGGTAINNPTPAAILEADALWPGEGLAVLSLGTGSQTEVLSPANGGLTGWLPYIPGIFFDFQASVLDHLARSAAKGVTRCDIPLGPSVNAAFDDASAGNLAALAALGKQLVTAQIDAAMAVLAPSASPPAAATPVA